MRCSPWRPCSDGTAGQRRVKLKSMLNTTDMSQSVRCAVPPPAINASRTVQCVTTSGEAAKVARFLLQPNLFGTPLTPGEWDDCANGPLAAIGREHEFFWFVRDGHQAVAAAMGIRQHANRTGMYQTVAFAVDRSCRHQGLGQLLLGHALAGIAGEQGRGLLFDTSAHPAYQPMRRLLMAMGFQLVGRFPDFYYPGEDALWYYRAIEHPSAP